ncbi:MAG: DNA primase [Alphaproteobacteria bacterium]|nr:DNA primase [Alphaproteobacteria bacterium]
MPLPPSFFEELRARVPVSEVVGKRVKLSRAGREYKGLCPFHNEKTPSFYVNDDKQFYHCFGCGAHGNVITFLMQNDKLSFVEAVEQLAGQAGMSVPKPDPHAAREYERQKSLTQLLERASRWFQKQLHQPWGREASQYLAKRGLSDDTIERFRLGYAPQDGQALAKALQAEGFSIEDMLAVGLVKKSEERGDTYSFFRNRVIFPVGDRRGNVVAFGARLLAGEGPKYLNSSEHALFHKGRMLYGLSRARAAVMKEQPIIVCEGYMDVIALVDAGYAGAVAPLGTALTEEQLAQLWRLLPKVEERDPSRDYNPILCFDGDEAGQRAAARAIERALPLITGMHSIRIATIPPGEDPDSLIKRSGKGAMQNVIDQAKSLVDVIWEMAVANRRLQTPEEKAALKSMLQIQLAKIADENVRTLYRDEIQRRLGGIFASGRQGRDFQSQGKGGRRFERTPAINPTLNSPVPIRRLPSSGQEMRERILLATIVNYPALFDEFGENLAHLTCATPQIDRLRTELIEILGQNPHEDLDAEGIHRHLSSGGSSGAETDELVETLSDLMTEGTYVHAGFARPGHDPDKAREGWKDIWNKYLREKNQLALKEAELEWARNDTDSTYARLLALKQEAQDLALSDSTTKAG